MSAGVWTWIFRVGAFSDWDTVCYTILALFLLSRDKGSMGTQIKILQGTTPLTSAAILLQGGLGELSKEMGCTIMNE